MPEILILVCKLLKQFLLATMLQLRKGGLDALPLKSEFYFQTIDITSFSKPRLSDVEVMCDAEW